MQPPQHTGDAVAKATSRGGDAAPELLGIVALPDRPGVRVAGEVDMTVRAEWDSALASLVEGGTHDVHLDLSGMTFIDVRGAGALVDVARTLPPGRRLVVRHPPQVLVRILETMWTGQSPTITIEAP